MNAERDFGVASVVFGIALGYSRAAASNRVNRRTAEVLWAETGRDMGRFASARGKLTGRVSNRLPRSAPVFAPVTYPMRALAYDL